MEFTDRDPIDPEELTSLKVSELREGNTVMVTASRGVDGYNEYNIELTPIEIERLYLWLKESIDQLKGAGMLK